MGLLVSAWPLTEGAFTAMDDQQQQHQHPYDKDIDWWINSSEGDMGLTGTHQAVMAQLERGGPGNSSGTNPDHMTDRHLDTVKRYRRVEAYWIKLDRKSRRVMRCYYEQRAMPQGMREELGKIAGVALMNANDDSDAHVADACSKLHQRPTSWRNEEPGKIALQVVMAARQRASEQVQAAHKALAVARGDDAKEWAHA